MNADPDKDPAVVDGGFSLRRLAEEAGLAIGLLTRIWLPRFDVTTSASLGSSFWAFPIVGAVVGVVGACIMVIAAVIGLGTVPAVAFGLIAMAVATGALHEDGLADFYDGVGGGSDRARKLEIMRDSHLGTFGALALILGVATEAALLVETIALGGLLPAGGVIIASAAVARLAIAVPLFLLSPARADGLGTSLDRPSLVTGLSALVVATAVGALCVGAGVLALIVGAGLGAITVAWLARRHIGGYTGDVFGATVVVAKVGALAFYILVVLAP